MQEKLPSHTSESLGSHTEQYTARILKGAEAQLKLKCNEGVYPPVYSEYTEDS